VSDCKPGNSPTCFDLANEALDSMCGACADRFESEKHSEIVHKLAAATRLATTMVQNGHRFDSETASWACGDCSEPFNDAFGKPRKHAHDCDAAHILGLERESER